MALAYLAYQGYSEGHVRFLADTGTNAFFQVKVGKSKRRYGGLEWIDEEGFVSPIRRHERTNPVFGTRFVLPVPEAAFANRYRYIQLWSYRTPDRAGPAVSSVLTVPVPSKRSTDHHPSLSLASLLHFASSPTPTTRFSLLMNAYPDHSTRPGQPRTVAVQRARPVRNRPGSYREQGVSESMFWTQLIGALPDLVQQAVPVISGLLGRGGAAPSGNGQSSGSSNDLAQAIARLIQQVTQLGSGTQGGSGAQNGAAASGAQNGSSGASAQNGSNGASAQNGSAPTSPEQSTASSAYSLPRSLSHVAQRCVSHDTLDLLRDHPRQMGMVLNDSILRLGGKPRARYSEATVAWAPIIAAVAPYVKDILELGNKADADQRRHLEKLAELLNDPALTALMAALSTTQAPPRFTPDPRVHIDTSALPRVTLKQKERVVYKRGAALTIPFRLATDRAGAPARPIPRAIVQATIQDTDTMAVLWEKEFRIREVYLNQEVRAVQILPEESRNLPSNTDLKLEITLRWRGKDRRTVYGALKNQYITLVDAVAFDRMGEKVGETLLLNDVVAHRPFWHKVWEGGYTDSRRWHIDFDAKYFYAVDLEDDEPARLETRILVTEDNAKAGEEMPSRRRVRARLKSGMELTVGMLHDLLPAQGHPEVPAEHLAALRHPACQKYLNQVARVHLEFKGKGGDTATLWVYPEVDVHRVHLLRVSQTNDDGQVLGLAQEAVLFPRPSALHFIGTQSD